MTQYQSSLSGSNAGGETVSTQRFVISRTGLHWPAIISGVFLTLTLFIIAAVLSQAVGLDFTFDSVRATGAEVGTIIWGGAAALICFGLGSYLTARVTRGSVHTTNAMLNGFVVWAVVVPILVYVLGGGIGPMLGKKAPALNAPGAQAALMQHSMNATAHHSQATVNNDPANGSNAMNVSDTMAAASVSASSMNHNQAAAWWMLVSLGCGLLGALICGSSGKHKGAATEVVSDTETRPVA